MQRATGRGTLPIANKVEVSPMALVVFNGHISERNLTTCRGCRNERLTLGSVQRRTQATRQDKAKSIRTIFIYTAPGTGAAVASRGVGAAPHRHLRSRPRPTRSPTAQPRPKKRSTISACTRKTTHSHHTRTPRHPSFHLAPGLCGVFLTLSPPCEWSHPCRWARKPGPQSPA